MAQGKVEENHRQLKRSAQISIEDLPSKEANTWGLIRGGIENLRYQTLVIIQTPSASNRIKEYSALYSP